MTIHRPLSLIALLAGALALASPAHATKIQRVISPGGIEAWLVHETAVPVIAMHFSFRGGASQDPADKPGVANLVAGTLDEGAGDLDSRAFHQRIEDAAIELQFSAGRDRFNGSIRMLREHRNEAFDLLRLSLTSPRFDTDAVERVRAQVISGLRRETTSPNDIATRTWWKTAFPDHPYGRPYNGTLESVPLITVDDLRAYVRHVLARDTLKITVVGDIDADTLRGVLDQVFGGLPARSALTPVAAVSFRAAARRVVVDLDVPQAVLTLGGVGIRRKDPDFMAAYLVNYILGGGSFTSRLYNEVREKRGLAYGVYSYLLPLDHTALFMTATQTGSDHVGEALKIIEAEMHRMAESGPTAEELAKAKAYVKGSYALAFDTSSKIAAALLQIQVEDLGIDYIQRRNALIDAVTLDDAKRVAKRLGAGGMLVTVVGRPKDLTSSAAEPAKVHSPN